MEGFRVLLSHHLELWADYFVGFRQPNETSQNNVAALTPLCDLQCRLFRSFPGWAGCDAVTKRLKRHDDPLDCLGVPAMSDHT